MVEHPLQKFRLGEEFFVAALGGVLRAVKALLHRFHVGEDEFQVDGRNISYGIDRVFHVRHVFVVKAPYDVYDRVHFAYVGKEFVAQSFALGRALHEPRDVHEFDDGGGDLLAVVKRRELVQPFVGYGNDAHVGFDGAERIIRSFRTRVRDRIEKSGFPHVGKPDYA